MAPIAVTLDRREPAAGIVSLLGENDSYVAARLESELHVLLESRLPVVVELAEATFIDSQVLSVLLGARHDAECAGLGFALALPDTPYTQVHRLLELTGLASTFAIRTTAEDALRAARDGASRGARTRAA
jgi:anti-anti-sigma factor